MQTQKQIHICADDETKKLLLEACDFHKIALSSFIRQAAVERARSILKNKVEAVS